MHVSVPPIDLGRAPAAMFRVLAPIAMHNDPRIFRVRLNCTQTSARRMRCVLRGYTRHGHRVLLQRIPVRAVRSHPRYVFEDFSGWVGYVPTGSATTATLFLDPTS